MSRPAFASGSDRSKDVDIAILSAVASADGRTVVLTTTPQENLQYELSVINIKALPFGSAICTACGVFCTRHCVGTGNWNRRSG